MVEIFLAGVDQAAKFTRNRRGMPGEIPLYGKPFQVVDGD
jgi:hypothetical protein